METMSGRSPRDGMPMATTQMQTRVSYAERNRLYSFGSGKPREVKIVLLGDACVGKSSIAVRYVADHFNPEIYTTVGHSFMSKWVNMEGSLYKFQIWDTAGQEKFKSVAPAYYRGADAAILVYDITSEKSFKCLQEWVSELKHNAPPNCVLTICGNKLDLEENRAVQTSTMQQYASEIGVFGAEVSAKDGVGISDVFEQICQRLPEERRNSEEEERKRVAAMSKAPEESGCC